MNRKTFLNTKLGSSTARKCPTGTDGKNISKQSGSFNSKFFIIDLFITGKPKTARSNGILCELSF